MAPLKTAVGADQHLQLQKLEAFAWQQLEQVVEEIEAIRSQLRPRLSPTQQRTFDRRLNRSILRLLCQYYQLLDKCEQQFVRRWRYEQIPDSSKWN